KKIKSGSHICAPIQSGLINFITRFFIMKAFEAKNFPQSDSGKSQFLKTLAGCVRNFRTPFFYLISVHIPRTDFRMGKGAGRARESTGRTYRSL
ncbi:MAG: hypothetical protein LBD50_00005, partial [Rickettsiales bacterium]|nr:hypothetical protein [Rickettsiales bacterium]